MTDLTCPTKTSFCGAAQTPPIIFLVSAPYSLPSGRVFGAVIGTRLRFLCEAVLISVAQKLNR
jgi:hypothetical protein